jgi:hypothetical protein
MRIMGAAIPKIGFRILRFGLELREYLAGCFANHVHLDTRGNGKLSRLRLAPINISRAKDAELGVSRYRRECAKAKRKKAFHE